MKIKLWKTCKNCNQSIGLFQSAVKYYGVWFHRKCWETNKEVRHNDMKRLRYIRGRKVKCWRLIRESDNDISNNIYEAVFYKSKKKKSRKKKERTIVMYTCKKCGYHFGTPHYIPNSKSSTWKGRCSKCGSRSSKFYRKVKL